MVVIVVALTNVLISAPLNERMTAMEGLDISNEIAEEWDSTSILVAVADGEDFNVNENGKSDVWWYVYSNDPSDNHNSTNFIVKMHSDNSYTTEILMTDNMPFNHEIEEWTIDSDEALEIAWTEPNFIEFREEYGVGEISMGLYYNNSEERAEWEITILEDKSWIDYEFLFRIDAKTGEILEASG